MAFYDDPVIVFYLLVALVVIGYLISLSLRARTARQDGGAAGAAVPETSEEEGPRRGEDLLLQFVQDKEGRRYGETVAVEEDRLIIKDGQTFYAAPLESFEKADDGVLVIGQVDWEAAKSDGEAWRDRSTKVIEYTDDEVPEDEIPPEDLRED